MMNQKRKFFLYKIYIVGLSLLMFFIIIIFQLFFIQMSPEKKKYEKFAQGIINKKNIIKAHRGNIYDINGNLLATSITKYNIHIDLKIISNKLFKQNINALCDSLEGLFNKPQYFFYEKLQKGRKENNRYFLLANHLSYSKFKKISNFPIFNKGKILGGFITEESILRVHPIKTIGERTIGYDNHIGKVGLEGAFSKFLSGKDGEVIEQRISSKLWKPLNYWNKIEAKHGKDIYTTININLQNVAYNALIEQLITSNASHGCVIVMDVKSGEIHTMVNLKKTDLNTYKDLQNFSVWESSEPGSTFKSIALLAALEDKKIDINTLVDIENGLFVFKGHYIKDSNHGCHGLINTKRILEVSSNIGIAKLIYKIYKDSPIKFIKYLKKWRLNKKLDVEIPGEGIPFIPEPNKKYWNNLTLVWMSFGYNLKMTPLQILTFYNAIANDGRIVKPIFIKKIRYKGKDIKIYNPFIDKNLIASKRSIKIIQSMLEGVVKNGTAKKFYHPEFPYAGKTGTTQLEYWIKNKPMSYNSSFVGYFPIKSPKYSCIVVISKPKKNYYGSEIAAPVFDKIAQFIYSKKLKKNILNNVNLDLEKNFKKNENYQIFSKKNCIPNLIGLPGKDIISKLESIGLIVEYKGVGKILTQSIPEGFMFKKNQMISLTLGK